MRKLIHAIKEAMFGDCDRWYCGHSVAYHVPIAGCLKCKCPEYV